MKYKVVCVFDQEELEEEINALISDGWIPQGGLSASWIPSEESDSIGMFAQAVIRMPSPVLEDADV